MLSGSETFKVGCVVEVENTADSLHAHVTLDDGIEIHPRDEVRVLGDPIQPAFGETVTLKRTAEVRRANRLEDWFTRLVGRFEITELFETSFSEWRKT